MMTEGRAHPQATRDFHGSADPDRLRRLGPWTVSSLGWGTNSGELRNIVDLKVESAVADVLAQGINLLDTSPAYRHRRSQAAVGKGLARCLRSGQARREQLVITSHCGFVALDRKEEDLKAYFKQTVLPASGLEEADFVACAWSMHPRWIRAQLDLARTLLEVDHIDLLFLDSPELALAVEGPQRWQALLLSAFGELESLVTQGAIGAWGISSLEGFLPRGERPPALRIQTLLDLARRAGGGHSNLAAIQAPFSLAQLQFLNPGPDGSPSLQSQLRESGLSFTAMLGLGQGQLCQGLPEYLRPLLPGCRTDAQRALQFVRSTPGVDTVLVGMKTREHIQENGELLDLPALDETAWQALFG
jgi:aryl-alcohol dehydrogenase-like predicted oxidoreductase